MASISRKRNKGVRSVRKPLLYAVGVDVQASRMEITVFSRRRAITLVLGHNQALQFSNLVARSASGLSPWMDPEAEKEAWRRLNAAGKLSLNQSRE